MTNPQPEPCPRAGCRKPQGDCSHVDCPRRRTLTACPPGYWPQELDERDSHVEPMPRWATE